MKILLLTFTGTRNTQICGDFLAKHFTNEGHEVFHYVYDARKPLEEDLTSYDMIGLGYPVHAFNTPEIFHKWIKTFPKVDNIPFFIYKVSGEPFHFNNASSNHFVKVLNKKGYKKIAEKHFLMPYNIIFRYKDEIAKQMYLYLDALTNAYVKEILAEDYELIKYGFWQKVLSVLFRIEWIAPKVNAPLVGIRKTCTKCNMCVNNCPTNAMYINKKNKIKIHGSKCALCMRCTYDCPNNSIRFGLLNPWVVNGPYNYKKLVRDESINPNFINEETKGYFKKFNKYFKKQNILLEKYKIENPIKDYLVK